MTIPDGTLLGGSNGGLFQVFAPPWWRIDRWIRWWFMEEREKGSITVAVHGETVTIRVRSSRIRLPKVANEKTQREPTGD